MGIAPEIEITFLRGVALLGTVNLMMAYDKVRLPKPLHFSGGFGMEIGGQEILSVSEDQSGARTSQ